MFAPKTATSITAGKTAESVSRSRVAFSSSVSATGDRARDDPIGRNVDPVIGRSGSWDFGSVTVFSLGQHNGYQQPYSSRSSRPWQPVLAVAPAGDPLEREADAVADQIMQRPERAPSISAAQVPHQLEVGPENTQSRGSKKRGKSKPAVNGAIIDLLRSPGRPLDSRLRDFMESRFRRDFSQVRVHDDALGANAAQAADARAFAAGRHIAFSRPFDQSSEAGRHLLAHELTHVEQQSALNGPSGRFLLQRQGRAAAQARPATQLPQSVIDLLQQTDGGQWALRVMRTYDVHLVLTQKDRPALYDANANQCTVNVALPPAVVASYFVHEMYHAQRERSGKGGDPKKTEREPFIKAMVNEEIQGTVLGYQAYLELERKGQVPANAPRPPHYDSYKSAYQEGREQTRKANPTAAEADLEKGALKNAASAIRWWVLEGGLGPVEGLTYSQYYAEEWKKAHKR